MTGTANVCHYGTTDDTREGVSTMGESWVVEVGVEGGEGRECVAEVAGFSSRLTALAAVRLMRGATIDDVLGWAGAEEWPHRVDRATLVRGATVLYYDGDRSHDPTDYIDF